MSMYTGIIKEQSEVVNGYHTTLTHYHALCQELIDLLSGHMDVTPFEERLKALKGGVIGGQDE